MEAWRKFLNNKDEAKDTVTIAICGKYVKHQDAYKSVEEALGHAAASIKKKLKIKWIDSERSFKDNDLDKELAEVGGVLIPGGFGVRGIEGKISIARYARENRIPYLGLCLGLHVMVIECARNLCKLSGAHSTEFDELSAHPVIHLMEDQLYIDMIGGSMRLGAYKCKLAENSTAFRAYKSTEISERHRHRYEFNNNYRDTLCKAGLQISGLSPDGMLVEVVEYPDQPFFVSVQFHPEFKSRPNKPHPLFREFVLTEGKNQ